MAFEQQNLLRNLVAACPTFQTEVGAVDKTAALGYVHRFAALEKWHPAPRAVVRFTSHSTYDEGHGNWRSVSSLMLEVEIERDLPADSISGLSDQEEEVIGVFGDIEEEIKSIQGQGEDEPDRTYVRVTNINLLRYDIDEVVEGESGDIQDPESAGTQKVKWWAQWEVQTK